VNGVAFSPDGKLLASADGDGTVRLWNPIAGQPVGAPIPAGPGNPPGGVNELLTSGVDGVAFSPDGKLLASADGDNRVRLSNPTTRQPVGTPLPAGAGPAFGTRGVAFSPDGRLLASANGDGTIGLWNPATRLSVGAPLHAGTHLGDAVQGVAFSPDGELLASADADGNIQLWDPATGQRVGAPLPASPGGVSGVAFSPDGKLLASGGSDGTVRIWQVSLFADTYAALCTDVGPPTKANWAQYAPGEPQISVCK
jgi:WD40 repeat protein